MNVVGLDLSLTATGVATEAGVEVLATKLRGCERLAWLRDAVLGFADPGSSAHLQRRPDALFPVADLVVVEGYAYGRANQAHQAGELGGVIRLALHEAAIPFVIVPPSSLKKLATGNGGAKKEAVLAAAIRRLGYQGDDHNESDAMWLREAALQHYGRSTVTLPAAHLAVLAKVDWPALTVTA